jgi:hypothetical protein
MGAQIKMPALGGQTCGRRSQGRVRDVFPSVRIGESGGVKQKAQPDGDRVELFLGRVMPTNGTIPYLNPVYKGYSATL